MLIQDFSQPDVKGCQASLGSINLRKILEGSALQDTLKKKGIISRKPKSLA